MYHPAATLILVGGHGTGKSTLAVIAAISLRRRFVDTVSVIEAAVSSTAEDFISRHGLETFCALEYALLETIIAQYPTDCVVATSAHVIHGTVRALLIANASKYPIVNISRSTAEITELFRTHPKRDTILRGAVTDMPLYRQCSTFEFTNLGLSYVDTHRDLDIGIDFENTDNTTNTKEDAQKKTSRERLSLGLRCLEKNFLNFVKYIYGDSEYSGPSHVSPPPGGTVIGPGANNGCASSRRRPWSCAEEKINPFSHALFLPFYDFAAADVDFDLHAVGVDALILRVDLLASYAIRHGLDPLFYISTQISIVRAYSNLPIIYDFDRSFFSLSLSLNSPVYSGVSFYADILNTGLRLCVEYITVNQALLPDNLLRDMILRKHFSKIIAVHSLPSWDYDIVREIHRECGAKGFDIVQFTSHAYTLKANIKLQLVLSQMTPGGSSQQLHSKKERHHHGSMYPYPQIPIIAYNRGPLGRMSQCLNKLLTPIDCEAFLLNPKSFYYSAEDSGGPPNKRVKRTQNAMTPSRTNSISEDPWITPFKGKQISDLLTLQDRNASIYSLGLQPRLQYYHFGSAVSTRLSDVVNQTAFDAVHLPHKYTKITARRVLEVQPYLEQQDFGGATISTPLKVNISQVCDSLSPQARVVGAVNSLVTVRDPWTLLPRAVRGDNVDWVGMRANIVRHIRAHNAITSNTKAVIIGAGGFAHAAIYSLVKLGVRQFYVWSKSKQDAEYMVEHYRLLFGTRSNGESPPPGSAGEMMLNGWAGFEGIGNAHPWKNGRVEVDRSLDLRAGPSFFRNRPNRDSTSSLTSLVKEHEKSVSNAASSAEGTPTGSFTPTESSAAKSPQKNTRKLLLKNILNSDDEGEEKMSQDTSSNENDKSKDSSPLLEKDQPSLAKLNKTLQTLCANPSSPASRDIWLAVLQGSLPSEDDGVASKIQSGTATPTSSGSSSSAKMVRNFGSLSFQQSNEARHINFTILESITDPWPEYKPCVTPDSNGNGSSEHEDKELSAKTEDSTADACPSIILHLTSDTNLRLHPTFFGNPTGGICLENNYTPAPTTATIEQALRVRKHGWKSKEALEASSEPSYKPSICHKNEFLARWEIIAGADFMLEQSFAHFEIFTEKKAPRKAMLQKMKECLVQQSEERRRNQNSPEENGSVEDVIHQEVNGTGIKPFVENEGITVADNISN